MRTLKSKGYCDRVSPGFLTLRLRVSPVMTRHPYQPVDDPFATLSVNNQMSVAIGRHSQEGEVFVEEQSYRRV